VRVSTAFNRMLRVPGAWVDDVDFSVEGVIVVHLRRKALLRRCPCGTKTRARYDTSRRRWRHLDLGAQQLWLEADIWRLDCRACGRVRTEEVPWARPGARHTHDFENVIAWLAQRTDKTSICRLLRVSWEAVQAAVVRVVGDHLDDRRLDGLFNLGVDEISYKRGHQYLTVVADHDTGRVVWVAEGRTQAALTGFFDALGPERRALVQAVSMDMATIYRDATRRAVPHAAICFDPFHLVSWANQALDSVFQRVDRRSSELTGREWRQARYALRAGAERLGLKHHELLAVIETDRAELFTAWQLKEEFRALFQTVEPDDAAGYLRDWIERCVASGLAAMVNLARKIDRNFEGIVNTVRLGFSNSRLEGINAKIRLINRRGYGHPNGRNLAAMIHLCLGGITIPLPTET
jgi:transposase